MTDDLTVAGQRVPPGQRRDIMPATSESYTGDRTSLPMAVLNGADPGPKVFVTATVHGDELNGILVCHEVLEAVDPRELAGSLIVVPIVNVLGAQIHSRYLPDRRDLNRSFPGSTSGSMAARIARLLMDEVVAGSTVGVDLHTATNNRDNVPQVRIDCNDPAALRFAWAFGAPFILDAAHREGSLREVAADRDVQVLTFEGGEALRIHPESIEVATAGVLRLLGHLDMLADAPPPPREDPVVMRESRWLRAERGGVLALQVEPGDTVKEGQEVWATISPLGVERATVTSPVNGVVIGATRLPLVTPGDAILHIGIPGDRPVLIDDPTLEEDVPDEDLQE